EFNIIGAVTDRLEFWLVLIDSIGLQTNVGSKFAPLIIEIVDRVQYSSFEPNGRRVDQMDYFEFTGDSRRDVVIGGPGYIEFFDVSLGFIDEVQLNYGTDGFIRYDYNRDAVDDIIPIPAPWWENPNITVINPSNRAILNEFDPNLLFIRYMKMIDVMGNSDTELIIVDGSGIIYIYDILTNSVLNQVNLTEILFTNINNFYFDNFENTIDFANLDNDGTNDLFIKFGRVILGYSLTKNEIIFLHDTEKVMLQTTIADFENTGGVQLANYYAEYPNWPDVSTGQHFIKIVNSETLDPIREFEINFNGLEETDLATRHINYGYFDNDNLLDFLISDSEGYVFAYANDGSLLWNSEKFNDYFGEEPILRKADITSDSVTDLFIISSSSIQAINGFNGKVLDELYTEAPITDHPVIVDFDNNDLDEIAIATSLGHFGIFQPINAYSIIKIEIDSPSVLVQGEVSQMQITLHDIQNHPIQNASISILGNRRNGGTISFVGTEIGLGVYNFTITTSNWQIGEWDLFPIIVREPYDAVDLNYYTSNSGNLLSFYSLVVEGNAEMNVISMISDGANANSDNTEIGPVTEGNILTLEFVITDRYERSIEIGEYNVSIAFDNADPNLFEISRTLHRVELNTTGLTFGIKELEFRVRSEYFRTDLVSIISIEIVPSFPDIDLNPANLLIIALCSLVGSSALMISFRRIYGSIQTNPEQVKKTVRNALMVLTILVILEITAGIIVFSTGSRFVSFLVFLLALGTGIMMVFFIHFRVKLNQYYSIQFKIRSWFGILVISLLIGVMMGFILLIGQSTQWIGYYMSLEKTNLILISIPRLVWEVGITGFLTGFLYILVMDMYDAYKDIKHIMLTLEEVEQDFYPKQPNKLFDTIVQDVKSTFTSLSKGFIIWYIIIIITMANSLNLMIYLLPLILSIFGPFIIAILIFFRFPLDMIGSLFGFSKAVSKKDKLK
ncbi:MAG: hypothetical protein OEY49_08335, partial [Candidatus Heimdallarchaeota archaeon]|nr:hypothetical protein [Candidatus Heimdallarchaeota archaeon]